MGSSARLQVEFVGGAGFVGIAVSLMGRNHPVGIIFSAILFGILYQGGDWISFEMPNITREMILVIQGLVILFAGALEYMVSRLGGPSDLLEAPDKYLVEAPLTKPVPAPRSGWLSGCDVREIGMTVVDLGGGRRHPADRIDHRVGISDILPLGTRVVKGDPIALVHAKKAAHCPAHRPTG